MPQPDAEAIIAMVECTRCDWSGREAESPEAQLFGLCPRCFSRVRPQSLTPPPLEDLMPTTHPTYYTTTVLSKRGGTWISADTITAGEARACLDAIEDVDPDAQSKVNPSFTRRQSIDIMRAGVADIADDKPIPPLTARNILRLVQRRKRLKRPE